MNSDFILYKYVGYSQCRYFGKQAKKLRKENGLTIKELAAKMGYRASTIEKLENVSSRCTNLTLENVLDYCRLFGVTPNDLLLNPKNPKFEMYIGDKD